MRLKTGELVLATVCYADIFAWPLTKEELKFWFIKKKFSSGGSLQSKFLQIIKHKKLTYVVLSGRKALIVHRLKCQYWAKTKWQIAQNVANILKFIPTIKLVGVTGGLACHNVDRGDDIDLFLITQKGTLWTTRLMAVILMEILGLRRRPLDKKFKDKICLNMLMSEEAIAVDKKERDLFSAHEVLQMRPLWERDGMYYRFLKANQWVKKFLPNAWKERNVKWPMPNAKLKRNNYLFSIYHLAFIILEPLARVVQLCYMKKRRTNEVITAGVLRFHPHDARLWIREALVRRLSLYNIPLDKIFYPS